MTGTFAELFEYITTHWQEASAAVATLCATLAGGWAIVRKRRKGDK